MDIHILYEKSMIFCIKILKYQKYAKNIQKNYILIDDSQIKQLDEYP